MKKFLLPLCVLILISLASADSPVKYSQIKIFVPDKSALDRIWESGIDYEGSTGGPGGWMTFIAGKEDLKRLILKNISYSIVVDDLTKEYQKHLYPGPQNALGFGFGSMGGFYTYDEVVQQLDSMRLLYPNLITMRYSIATTDQGRKLWVVKISSNPNANDSSKPEVFYTGLHHAREPEGIMAVIYYMWWLLGNYGSNPEATYLVNTRQMWFLPVTNPDGYAYNQATNPGGGGLWRKNMHNNGDGTFGVDPNRNYGNYDMWNSPYGGSDDITSSDSYRGTGPFSEAETKGIAAFLAAHNFKTCINYHTFGNYIIYPWGYMPSESSDSVIFREYAFDISGYNHYLSGTDMQTVKYVTRGGSDDYMYGDTTKPKTITMTLEIGGEFWASTDQILPLAVQDLEPNKYMSFVAGQYTTTKRIDVTDQHHTGGIERGESFTLDVTLRNKGLGNSGRLFVNVASTNPGIVWISSDDTINAVIARDESHASFSGFRNGAFTTGSDQFIVTITDANGYLHRDTILSFLGKPYTLFTDSADNATANWDVGQGWDIGELYVHTPPNSFTDSPYGDYNNNADNSLTLLSPIDLTGYNHASLKFWISWAVEPRYDFALFEASYDNGSTWDNLRTSLMHHGTGIGAQNEESWGFDGYTPGLECIEQQADLSSYAGQQIQVRFRMLSDAANTRDGIYVDDIRIIGYKDTVAAGTSLLPVRPKWNLISLPLLAANRSKASLFPTAGSAAYRFDRLSGYVASDTLLNGKGYWLKFDANENISISGSWSYLDTIALEPGWNMIGSISTPVAVSAIGASPAGITSSSFFFFSQGSGYTIADTIMPGMGYWVKANQSGKIILSASPALTAKNRLRIVRTSELPPPPPSGSAAAIDLPKEFRLEQNYPNPFNPTTTINYAIPAPAYVSLKVYNTLGQEIVTLIDGLQTPGYKSAEFETGSAGGGLPSGIYFYRLTARQEAGGQAGSFTDVKKMVIIK
jgi:hypothetical protein